ncbi:MAG: methyltransferase family protein [Gemmatimonadales bacterium]
MQTVLTLLRALVYAAGFVLLWGWLALTVQPLDRSLGAALPAWVTGVGWVLVVAGAAIVLACVGWFVVRGAGTPAPFDAPRRFVARGPYRYVRNPMYLGGWGVLAGWGLLLRSPAILLLSFVMLGGAHLFVVLYEEPTLERRFGNEYQLYRKDVRRWLPRLPGD